jgi:hypothetical protein
MSRLLALGKASISGWLLALLLALLLAVLPLAAADDPLMDEPAPEEQTTDEPVTEVPVEDEPGITDEDPAVTGDAGLIPSDPSQLPPFPPRSQFDEMLERPLFHSSRRPQASEPSGGSAQELRETWKLTGIILVGEQVRALFQERNGERRLTLGVGMPLDASWVLDEINLETVVMGSGDEQVTLELLEPRDTTPIVAPEREPQAGDGEAAPLDERTQEASRQLEQDSESVKETLNE